ncbi:hypothetical protein JOF56_008526 [Kibdelosporangium banguiense]|uniref:Alpha-L-arabinofuranosidase B arabinose-binding domain-containing protein n=1 Tax=Kibdelosporangium banguiense TaxID=1365924 RepID=A0ABS4TUP3_9PSEU|nr:AbfB domain-containing protein [Kibdelosporangium banguiense]MBP2328141.1 hypothetical protein [Kibdelosporangium banguiense]
MRRTLAMAVAVFGLLTPIAAHAATPPAIPNVQAEPRAVALPEATPREKVNAVNEIEVGEATDDWVRLSDRNFVFKVYETVSATKFPLTKAEAARVYGLTATDATAFIRTGIFEFAARDRAEKIIRDREREHLLETRLSATGRVRVQADPLMLDATDKNFVFQIFSRVPADYPKVKSAAATAYRGDAVAWKNFVEVAIHTIADEDDLDAIRRLEQEDAEKARKKQIASVRMKALAAIPAAYKPIWNDVADDVFIRELLLVPELALPKNIEVKDAADLAARSTDPLAWKTFIERGIHEAKARDNARQDRLEDEADRRVVREVKAKAENSGLLPRLVAAANTALAGSHADVVKFLREGQYQYLTQSLGTTTPGVRGWYIDSAGGDAWITPGNAGTGTGGPLTGATWKVANGLADSTCYSFESTDYAGSYLRQQDLRVKLHGNDGTDQFKLDATWCPRLVAGGVRLESKAQPGRFIRHVDAQLWVAQAGGPNWFDTDRLYQEDSTWTTVDPNPQISTPLMLGWFNDDQLRSLAGNPKAAEVYDNGVRYRDFDRGRVYWSESTGSKFLTGQVLQRYSALNLHKQGYLPIEHQTSRTNHEHVSLGSYIAVYWSPASGAKLVMGAIRAKWESLGGVSSPLGYPISDEYATSYGARSDFQNGYSITWDATTHEVRVWRNAS